MNILATTLTLALMGSAYQDDATLQIRAKSALEATGFRFETTASGKNYSIKFDHPNNRSQTVYMNVKPSKLGNLVIYNFYTQVWYSSTTPDEAFLRKVLTKLKKLGAYYLFKDSNNTWTVRFNVKLDATDMPATPKADDALVKILKDMVYFVNAVGEETDLELNGSSDIR